MAGHGHTYASIERLRSRRQVSALERAPTERELRRMGFDFQVPEIDQVLVYVVDDSASDRYLLETGIELIGHPAEAFASPREALAHIRRAPPHILVTDMMMPEMSGIDLAHEARSVDPDMGVILVTGVGDANTAAATIQAGVSSYLTKPVEIEALRRELQRAYLRRAARAHHRAMMNWMYEAMDRNAQAIREVTVGTLTSLANAMDARSAYFRGHSRAVAMQAAAVAETLGLDEEQVESVRVAGLLHDIGMIGVPDTVIEKTGTLTDEETDLIRAHCWVGASILRPMTHIAPSVRFVLEHHERWDGSGYPQGKEGDDISLGGQIVAISEAWTAILESRAHRASSSREDAMQILRSHAGSWFTNEVTEALIASDLGLL